MTHSTGNCTDKMYACSQRVPKVCSRTVAVVAVVALVFSAIAIVGLNRAQGFPHQVAKVVKGPGAYAMLGTSVAALLMFGFWPSKRLPGGETTSNLGNPEDVPVDRDASGGVTLLDSDYEQWA